MDLKHTQNAFEYFVQIGRLTYRSIDFAGPSVGEETGDQLLHLACGLGKETYVLDLLGVQSARNIRCSHLAIERNNTKWFLEVVTC